jgi:2-polyprenyl-3-methyl-5-hydroxy-6-metoxy-1,4-benzoquinol methylase
MSAQLGADPSAASSKNARAAAGESCPICGEPALLAYERMYDDRYGYPGVYTVRRCAKCGHMYLAAGFTADEITSLYTQYYPRGSFSVDQHRIPPKPRGLNAWLRGDKCAAFYWVEERVRVLDVGCGFCESLAYHKARGCEVYGVEADANVRKVAEAFGYRVHIGLFDPSLYESEYFDFITLDQVIEHVGNPREFMSGIARILKPGGRVIVSTPNSGGLGRRLFGPRWIHWHIPYHLQHFTSDSMRMLAELVGLEVAGSRTLTHSEWLYFQLMHLIAIPQCGSSHPFWAGKPLQSRRARAIARLIGYLRRARIHQVASRALDALGVGDNRLYTLRKPAQQRHAA